MASAAASKIENGKQARSITICKKALHASIDLVVKHIVAVKDFLINRPRVKKILFGGLRHGFALLICRFKNLRFGRLSNPSAITVWPRAGSRLREDCIGFDQRLADRQIEQRSGRCQ